MRHHITRWVVILLSTLSLCIVFKIAALMLLPLHFEQEEVEIYIDNSTTERSVIEQLQMGISKTEMFGIKLLLNIKKYNNSIKTGHYIIKSGSSASNIVNTLQGGMQVPIKLVIRGHREIGQMAQNISSQLMLDSATIAQHFTNINYLQEHGFKGNSPFYLVIPNTYEVYWNISIGALVDRLIKEYNNFWNESRIEKANRIELTPFQIMTLASIVEEETAKREELPIVAGLYINRLKRGMPLQADPTVIYAIGGERPKRVLKQHLEIDSPYNTYIYKGLPPTPIRFVNIQSIDAVLNYSRHKYIYMCAKEDFSGYHNFSTNLTEHNRNARLYQKALSTNR